MSTLLDFRSLDLKSLPVHKPWKAFTVIVNIGAQAFQERNLDSGVAKDLSLALVTPWQQMCGNAEYAHRLATALEKFADVIPFDLRNLTEDAEMRNRRARQQHFADLVARVNAQRCDLVHIQHEFCFFGASIGRSNRQFLQFVREITAPIVVTLHTWTGAQPSKEKRKRRLLSIARWLNSARASWHDGNLYRALGQCEAIVVHTDDTFSLISTAFPQLRKKLHVVQIPIAPVDAASATPCLVKPAGEFWIMLPGFVSPYKGHQHAIGALKHLPLHFKLVIAGGRHPKDRNASRYWMELLTQVEQLNLQSRVLFTGFMATAEEQAAMLRQADLFLLPYDEVGQSGSAVLADALAHDRPVLTSRARSMFAYRMTPDTVYSSVSTDVADHAGLVRCIEDIAAERYFAEELKLHRTAAMERFSLDSIGSAYQKLYQRYRSNS